MSFDYQGPSYVTNVESYGAQSPQLFCTPHNSSQSKVLNINSTQYFASSTSPPTPENKENKIIPDRGIGGGGGRVPGKNYRL